MLVVWPSLRLTWPSPVRIAVHLCVDRASRAPLMTLRHNLPQAPVAHPRPMLSMEAARRATSENRRNRWPSMTLRRPRPEETGRSKTTHPKVRCNSRIAPAHHPLTVFSYTLQLPPTAGCPPAAWINSRMALTVADHPSNVAPRLPADWPISGQSAVG
jgi:hypothetical protein